MIVLPTCPEQKVGGASNVTESPQSATLALPEFLGDVKEQDLARKTFLLLRASASFFSLYAPIRLPLDTLADYLAQEQPSVTASEWRERLRQALERNSHVFRLETDEAGVVFVVTTRGGTAPSPEASTDTAHQLPRRFLEPPPEAVPLAPRQPRPSTVSPPSEAPIPSEVEVTAEEQVIPAAETISDISVLPDEALAAAIRNTLSSANEVVGFGDLWAVAEILPRLSRGDVRRIREYIVERGEPLADTELLEVILNVTWTTPEFPLYQLALNSRLAQEEDFEFVGVPGAFLWITRDISPIPTPKRRLADIGQDYRYLLEETTEVVPASETIIDHVLTFYEHLHGVLPYDATLAAVLPVRVLPTQTRAILRFQSVQTHESFWVELRFPTANRGGFLYGFATFFATNLVPGALITVERGDSPNTFLLDYLPTSRQERRLLVLDEKTRKYVFRPTTYFCAVQESTLLTEQRFSRLAGQEPLDERARRLYERVLEITFERIGENIGTSEEPRYMATLEDLVAAVNVERPLSADRIQRILTSGEYPQFSADPDVVDLYYFTPRR